jgi:hypothetical protein
MSTTTGSVFYDRAEVSEDPAYQEQINEMKTLPRVWGFEYMLGDNQYKLNVVAPDAEAANFIFYNIVGPEARLEGGPNGGPNVHYTSPDCEKFYRKRLGMKIGDAYYQWIKQEKERAERRVLAEQEKHKADKAKKDKQKINHLLDVLASAASLAKRMGFAQEQKDREQSSDFMKWMKIKND